jgi:hypothetical protein
MQNYLNATLLRHLDHGCHVAYETALSEAHGGARSDEARISHRKHDVNDGRVLVYDICLEAVQDKARHLSEADGNALSDPVRVGLEGSTLLPVK